VRAAQGQGGGNGLAVDDASQLPLRTTEISGRLVAMLGWKARKVLENRDCVNCHRNNRNKLSPKLSKLSPKF
jgi:cytochrome c551/c552